MKKSRLYGVGLALLTAVLWGCVPIQLRMALTEFHPKTIVAFRFCFAAVALLVLLRRSRQLSVSNLRTMPWIGYLGAVSLAINYYYYMEGAHYSSPTNTELLCKINQPVLLLVAVFFFKETMIRVQVLGLILASLGFYLFYSDQLTNVSDIAKYGVANFYIFVSAIAWVVYAITQKQLATRYRPQVLNFLAFVTGGAIFLGMTSWSDYQNASLFGWFALISLGLNTLIAYGAYVEAVVVLPLSEVVAIISVSPLMTLITTKLLARWGVPGIEVEIISDKGLFGAFVAICGVVLIVSQQKNRPALPPATPVAS